ASRDDNDNDATMRSGLIRVGAQGGALSGVASGPLPRVAAFLQAEGLLSWAPELSVRFAAVGARGSSVTSIGAIGQGYWAGRLEICPVSFGGKGAFLSPCAAGELGQIWASGSLSDSALWGALGAHARGVWALSPR